MSGWGLLRPRAVEAAEGPWTVLSRGTRVQGEIRGRHPVRVDGSFDGTVQIEGVLHIGATAVLTGEFRATHLIVEGTVEGLSSGEPACPPPFHPADMERLWVSGGLLLDGDLVALEVHTLAICS